MVVLQVGQKLKVLSDIPSFSFNFIPENSVLEVTKIWDDSEYPYSLRNSEGYERKFHAHNFNSTFEKRFQIV